MLGPRRLSAALRPATLADLRRSPRRHAFRSLPASALPLGNHAGIGTLVALIPAALFPSARETMTVRRLTLTIALSLTVFFGITTAAVACDGRYDSWCGKNHAASYNKSAIKRVAELRGYGPENTERMLWIAYRESTYRNWATNGPCKGLFQVNTSKPKSSWANPYWNTNRAITYIKNRYGTPARAIQHIKRYGWY